MKTILTLAASSALLCASITASAAGPREPVGVIGGALVGAAVGGPVGALAGLVLGGSYANKSDQLAQGVLDLDAITQQVDATEAQLENTLAQLERAENKLLERSRTLSAQDERIDQLVQDQMLLSALRLRVRFATDDATLTADDQETLAILAQYLSRHPEMRVRLDGHADARGSQAHNDKLSVERARAVGAALTGHDVGDQQIDIRGFGESEATADVQNLDDLAAERRVEVQLVPPGEATERVSKTLQ